MRRVSIPALRLEATLQAHGLSPWQIQPPHQSNTPGNTDAQSYVRPKAATERAHKTEWTFKGSIRVAFAGPCGSQTQAGARGLERRKSPEEADGARTVSRSLLSSVGQGWPHRLVPTQDLAWASALPSISLPVKGAKTQLDLF